MQKIRTLVFGSLILMFLSAPSVAGEEKLNSSLGLLRALRDRPQGELHPGSEMLRAMDTDKAVVTVKFDHVLSPAEIAEYEGSGLSFYYIDGEVARTKSIYPVRVPWALIDELGDRREILRMEGNWRPAIYPLLDVSAPEIEADSVRNYNDPLGLPLTGKGKRIADFDTGIDVFHPSFFYADGDTLDWLDINENNSFDAGVDAVDLNRNGQYDTGETLRFSDGWIYDVAQVWGFGNPSNGDFNYQTYWDWLYADQNDNGARDFGPSSGYTEIDPTFGEPFFITLDDNQNGALDVGEKLVTLGTSKVYATMNSGAVERIRGVDLIASDDDDNGHGTAVSGILAGGTVDRHIFAGVAPDAEILAGYFFSDVPISLLIPWARARGADVMLYEFGGFIYDFLDGSSLDEELITHEHPTITQVTPSGNLGRGRKHAVAVVAAMDSVTLRFGVPVYNGPINRFYSTTLWRTYLPDLTFRLITPQGHEFTLVDSISYPAGYYVWQERSSSPRGTQKFDLYVDRGYIPDAVGTWNLKIVNNVYRDIEIICNVADDHSSWAGGSEFQNYYSDQKNVTFPATSDSSLVNGSYSTRGFDGYGGVGGGSVPAGEISAFSGRGKRVDGETLLDVCSPGNYDVYTTRSHTDAGQYPPGGYRQFSGTSAAGPHVAAAAAIVQQAYPHADMGQVEWLINSGAVADVYTGAVHNDTWGYGKLRILGAIRIATAVTEMADGKRPPELFIDQNYPNPFNPTTWIPFYLPEDGVASLTVYSVTGELVKTIRERWYGQGPHSVRWDGTDHKGRNAASGVYFCVLRQGGKEYTRKMTLLR
jgi:subtilisin family serine protease